MRIALVTETFYPAIDETTTTVKAVADRLVDTGHEVLIIAPAPGLASYRSSAVARIRALDRPGGQVREALERFAPDLVHVTSPDTVGRKALKHASRGRGPGHAPDRWWSSATSAASATATTYDGSRPWRGCRASGRSSSATVPSAAGSRAGCTELGSPVRSGPVT